MHISELPLRPQDEVECRRCGVHCDKVVYPAACVEKACPFLYAIEEFGHRYVGCMQNVFDVEIDVDLLAAAERTRSGFGAVKAMRHPLPMCTTRSTRATRRASTTSGASTPSSTSCRSARRRSRSSRAYRSTSGRSAAAPTAAVAAAAKNATRHDAPATIAANAIGMTMPPTPSTVC